MNGMVSGICVDWKKMEIVLVPNAAPEKPEAFGLPGGVIGRDESIEQSLIREWREEVWGHGTPEISPFLKIRRVGMGSPYLQHLFIIQDNGRDMRKCGVKGETKAPVRVSLWDVARGNVEVFFSHKLAIFEFLKKMAPSNKDSAFLAIMMAKKLGVEI